jgi:hypothetical protein
MNEEAGMYIVEHDEVKDGRRIVVVFTSMGHRCGYVGVTEGHKLHGKGYSDLDNELDVHGGLTYSGHDGNYPVHNEDGVWWFVGFDCAHYNDFRDTEAMVKYGFGDRLAGYDIDMPGSYVRSKEYVLEECYRLADQMGSYAASMNEEVAE